MISTFVRVLLITSAACLVIGTVPPLAVVAALLWGVTLLLGGHWLEGKQTIFIFGLNMLLLFGLAGNSFLFFPLIFGMPSLIMALQLGNQKGYYEVQRWGMLSAVFIVGLFLGVAYYTGQENYLETSPQMIEVQVDANLNMLEETGLLRIYEQQGLSAEELSSQFTSIYEWSWRHLPAWYLIQSLLVVFVVIRIAAHYGRRKGLPLLERKPFTEESMPWPVAWVVIIGLALMLSGWEAANQWFYIGSNLVVASAPVAIYFGVATMVHFWRRMSVRARRWWTFILILNIMFFTLPAIIFIGLLGLFDSLLDYRGLEPKKEGPK